MTREPFNFQVIPYDLHKGLGPEVIASKVL